MCYFVLVSNVGICIILNSKNKLNSKISWQRYIINAKRRLDQGSQFHTVPAGTAGIYHTSQCTSTDNSLVSYWKKYQPYRRNPAILAGKWISGKDREIPKKNSHEFSKLTQSCCTWPEPELELMLARQETSSRS